MRKKKLNANIFDTDRANEINTVRDLVGSFCMVFFPVVRDCSHGVSQPG